MPRPQHEVINGDVSLLGGWVVVWVGGWGRVCCFLRKVFTLLLKPFAAKLCGIPDYGTYPALSKNDVRQFCPGMKVLQSRFLFSLQCRCLWSTLNPEPTLWSGSCFREAAHACLKMQTHPVRTIHPLLYKNCMRAPTWPASYPKLHQSQLHAFKGE